ncbi:MAG TPA: hypothetical protein VHZ54_05680 [Solirubrobacterales bacterium]|nr:hypothetical protein [Solirubrobacterales bacterium]
MRLKIVYAESERVEMKNTGPSETFIEPLLTPPGLNRFTATGILTDPALAPLSLKIAADG